MLSGWTKFEKGWLLLFTAINLYLFFAWGDSLLGLISSIAGMLCVLLVAKGKISNYYFGIVQASTYAYITFGYGLYGESMLNALFFLPIQFIGIYLWNKNKVKNCVMGEEVRVKRLTKGGWLQLAGVAVVSSITYAFFLDFIGGREVRLDSITVVLSVIAQILMLKRYAEQWVLWISVNVLTIALWLIVLIGTGGNDWNLLVMFVAFLVNSVYGYWNWIKMHKKQEEVFAQ